MFRALSRLNNLEEVTASSRQIKELVESVEQNIFRNIHALKNCSLTEQVNIFITFSLHCHYIFFYKFIVFVPLYFQTGSSFRSLDEAEDIAITIPTFRLQSYGSDSHYEYEVKVCAYLVLLRGIL